MAQCCILFSVASCWQPYWHARCSRTRTRTQGLRCVVLGAVIKGDAQTMSVEAPYTAPELPERIARYNRWRMTAAMSSRQMIPDRRKTVVKWCAFSRSDSPLYTDACVKCAQIGIPAWYLACGHIYRGLPRCRHVNRKIAGCFVVNRTRSGSILPDMIVKLPRC